MTSFDEIISLLSVKRGLRMYVAVAVATLIVSAIVSRLAARRRSVIPRVRVIIIGGSFAGLAVLRELLAALPDADVTLVEPRDYVEYVPGILRAFVDSSAAQRLLVPLASAARGARHVRAWADAVLRGAGKDANGVTCAGFVSSRAETAGSSRSRACASGSTMTMTLLPFDVCVIATGSSYPAPIRGGTNSVTLTARLAELDAARLAVAAALASTTGVRIVGGGPVGVELAAELAAADPRAAAAGAIELFATAPRLLVGMHAALGDAALAWLKANCVRVKLSAGRDECGAGGGGGVGSVGGPLVIKCYGAKGNTAWIDANTSPELAAARDSSGSGRLLTRPTLQLMKGGGGGESAR